MTRIGKVAQILKHQTGTNLIEVMNSLKNRIILQKNVYLAQEAGLESKLNYSYFWYLYGPYSVELSNEAYEFSKSKQGINESDVDTDIKSVSEKLILAFGDSLKNERDSELLASIVYALKNWEGTNDKLIEDIQLVKPRYSVEEISTVLKKIRDSQLFSISTN